MKYECEMIKDLLPLYKDGVCSASSTKAVEEHISECPECTKILEELKDTVIDEMMIKEKEEVLSSQANFFKRKSAMIGCIIAGVFALPILICLIANLATGHGLSWFFIVLAAMLIPTSLLVVPLLLPKNRMFFTMSSFTLSVILLLAVCSILSGGTWFFVAASAVLFGLSVCFSPFIVNRRPVKDHLGNVKGLTAMAVCTMTFFLMMFCIGLYVVSPLYNRLAFIISVPCVILFWILFLIIRYLPGNAWIKAGTAVAAFGIVGYAAAKLILYLLTITAPAGENIVYTDNSLGMVIPCAVIGAILVIVGFLKKEKTTGQAAV